MIQKRLLAKKATNFWPKTLKKHKQNVKSSKMKHF